MDREQAIGTVLNVLTDWGSRVAVADRPRLAAYIVDALAQPVERAEKAEAAARDFAGLLRQLAVQDELRTGSGALARVAEALARYPEYASPDESVQDVPTVNQ